MRVLLPLVLFAGGGQAAAADWPTRLHDVRRGGITTERLTLPLTGVWTHAAARPPAPAWTESPARHDYLHNYYDLKPRQNFDRCFDVAVVGGLVYFGSSNSGVVTCLNAATGKTVWEYFTEAPVRFAPHVAHGNVYVGSDDGYVYCLRAKDGSLVWRERAGPTDEMIWGNQHMISVWPVRSSVLVDGEDVYWSAGIFPQEGMVLCKRNAADGQGGWTVTPKMPIQGYLLATPAHLFTPTGKTYPQVYARSNGAHVGDVKASARDGGCWALLTPEDNHLWSAPSFQNKATQLDANRRAQIATVGGANFLIADAAHAYYNTDSKLCKINRRDRATVWRQDAAYPYALIKAADTLFAGGEGEVAAFDADGHRVWTAPVNGKAYGLAVADGSLYVSTDAGSIHCFAGTIACVTNTETPTDVTARSAALVGRLVSAGGTPSASVTVFWGTADGGTNESRWAHKSDLGQKRPGALHVKVEGLKASSMCYYRFRASNSYGHAWAPSSAALITDEVTIQAPDAAASEQGLDPGMYLVSRPGWATAVFLRVRYTVGGTAVEGSDYEALPGTVTFKPGETTALIPVKPLDDVLISEPPKSVTLTLAPGGYLLGTARSATVTIADDDRLSGWAHRMKITFSGYDRSKTLRDFPALVVFNTSLKDFAYAQFASPSAADLRFTDSKGTRFLNYEIETWNAKSSSHVWVQVPAIANSEDHIWAYWGNPACTQRPAHATGGAAWSAGYAGVWHLAETKGPHRDATRNANHGTPEHGVVQVADGMVGGADRFDGDNDQITLASTLPIGASSNTVTAWVKVPATGGAGLKQGERVGILLGNYKSNPNCNWELHAAGEMRAFWNGGQIDERAKTDLRDNGWHHLAWVRDKRANRFHMYVDGRLDKAVNRAGADVSFGTTHKIGGDNRPNPPNFHGTIDEVRISTVARSADWIWASWRNQSANDAFNTCGPVQRLGDAQKR